jgi:hypothetical protein
MPTPARLLIETRLGRPLDAFVGERLDAGDGWRKIAKELRYKTDVRVSHETLRGWFPEHQGRAVA